MDKPTTVLQNRAITLRNADGIDTSEENRTYDFVISTETADSYNTVFRASGCDTKRYESNPLVCLNHRSSSDDPDDILGLSVVFREGNEWIGRVTLETGNPKADKVKRKIDNGTMRGASIGVIVHEGNYGDKKRNEDPDLLYFTRWELLEWSIVGLNSNPDAVKRNQEGINTAFAKADSSQPQTRNTAVLDEFDAAYSFNKNNS